MEKVVSEAAEPTLVRIAEDEKRVSGEVGRLLRYLAAHLFDVGFGAEDVKLAFGPEADDLIATFAAELGIRLADYIAEAQIEVALRLLLRSDLSPTRISEHIGYYSPATFTNALQRYFGLQPGKLRVLLRSAVAPQRVAPATSPGSSLPRIERARVTRRLVEGLWEIIGRLSFPDGLAFLRGNAFFGAEDLLELLSRRSRELGRLHRGRGVELAELALATMEGSAPLLAASSGAMHISKSRRAALPICGGNRASGGSDNGHEAQKR